MVLAFRSEEEILMRAEASLSGRSFRQIVQECYSHDSGEEHPLKTEELKEMGQNPHVDLHLQLSAPSAGWWGSQSLPTTQLHYLPRLLPKAQGTQRPHFC